MEVIKINNLNKSYGTNHVLKDVSLEINKGEIVAIVGPNGTGKTTLMEIMMTLRKADTGSITILGNDVAKDKDKDNIRGKIGSILQEGGMYNFIKLKEALDLFGSYYGVSNEKIDELVDEFELRPYINTKFNKMSGGWKQRFLLAIAFLHDPELIFLDEPTTGLDPKAAQILWQRIRGTKRDNRTIILTTHSMEEVEKFCDRAIILNEGIIVANDTPKNLKKRVNKQFFTDVYFDFVERREMNA